MTPFSTRHPVLTAIVVLSAVGLVVRWWWVLLSIAVLAGVVLLKPVARAAGATKPMIKTPASLSPGLRQQQPRSW